MQPHTCIPMCCNEMKAMNDGKEKSKERLAVELENSRKRVSELEADAARHKLAEEVLQQSEKKYRVLFESCPDGILIAEKASRQFLYANPAICTLLGYSQSELTSMNVLDIHPKESLDHVLFEFELQASGKKPLAENLPCRKSDGTVVMVDINVAELILDGVESVIGFFRDITRRKLVEEELLKARKLESVGLLAGGIAHDFNNILTGLFGNIELAGQKLPSDHESFDYIQNANRALEKATNLTQQLLTFAKGSKPILNTVDIGQTIQESIKFSLSGSNVKTTLNLPDDLWQVKADKGQLSQVFTNLVINAIQAMPAGGILTIEAENIRDSDNSLAFHHAGEVIKLSIGDDGCGISEEYLKQIFDPYFTTKHTGSGLGLATVHSIISKHNGTISVDSKFDVGTTFTIYLPADSSLSLTSGAISSYVTEKPGYMMGLVLLMDDDEMILNFSSQVIETFGYTVDTAANGKEVVEKYISAEKCGTPFDAVILDLTIPGGMGGKEAMKELLAHDPEVKAIVSSGYSTDSVMANYNEYGFKGRLVKPFQAAELKVELSRLLEP